MFQAVFPSIIRSSTLHIQRQVFVRPLLLPAASLARLAAGSSNGLTLYVQFWAPDDGRKPRLKHAERLTEINKLWNVASCWLYSATKPEIGWPNSTHTALNLWRIPYVTSTSCHNAINFLSVYVTALSHEYRHHYGGCCIYRLMHSGYYTYRQV